MNDTSVPVRAKQNAAGFLAGFIISILFVLLLMGLLYVNYHAYKYEMPDYEAIIQVERDRAGITVGFAGNSLKIRWAQAEKWTPLAQKLTVFLPGFVRTLLCGWSELLRTGGEALSFWT